MRYDVHCLNLLVSRRQHYDPGLRDDGSLHERLGLLKSGKRLQGQIRGVGKRPLLIVFLSAEEPHVSFAKLGKGAQTRIKEGR